MAMAFKRRKKKERGEKDMMVQHKIPCPGAYNSRMLFTIHNLLDAFFQHYIDAFGLSIMINELS